VALRVNGTQRELTVDTRVTLLDALREHLGLTGPRKGCDQGARQHAKHREPTPPVLVPPPAGLSGLGPMEPHPG